MIQTTAWVLTLVLILPVVVLFLTAAFAQKPAPEPSRVIAASYQARKWAFWGIVIGVTPVMLYTLTLMPYGAEAQPGAGAQDIEVTGHMWRWEMSETEVQAGETVRFHVTSADVNHGLGIYDTDYNLLTQTQAMPEYTNVLEYTFEEPGTYQLLCLEYCGVAHHDMVAELTVTE